MRSNPLPRSLAHAAALFIGLPLSLYAGPTPAEGTSTKCLASCMPKDAECAPDPKKFRVNGAPGDEVPNCAALGPTKGNLQIRYRRNRMVFTDTANPTRTVAMVMQQFPPDPCSLGDLACTQKLMNQHGAPSGAHPADGRKGNAGGEGEPCARGLPCGQVGVPVGAWTLALQDGTFAGQWVLSIIRSPKGETLVKRSLPVVGGRIEVPDGLLQPGTLYGYDLLDSAGARAAAGEFNVLAPSAAQALRRIAAERTAKEGGDATKAWLDTLVENELEWNVYQLLATGRAPQ